MASLSLGGEWEAQRRANHANWEDRVDSHVGETSRYSKELAAVRARQPALQPTEVEELAGCVEGKSCLHLQCHIGTDTLSLKHLGARQVVGLDFSGKALAEAAKLTVECGLANGDARWVESDVFLAPEALNGELFDLVYCSVGTLCWIPDIKAWARAAGRCLAPGGTFYIRDGHPMAMALADDATDGYMDREKDTKGARDLLLAYPYFETKEPNMFEDDGTYADPGAKIDHRRTFEWNHPLGAIVTALIQEGGLTIEFVHEHKTLDWEMLDFMERDESLAELGFGGYRLPPHQTENCPLMFSIRARKSLSPV
eukprot:COSAG05_NODE_235_length_13191_cov_7.667354_6_plen_312_part_00